MSRPPVTTYPGHGEVHMLPWGHSEADDHCFGHEAAMPYLMASDLGAGQALPAQGGGAAQPAGARPATKL